MPKKPVIPPHILKAYAERLHDQIMRLTPVTPPRNPNSRCSIASLHPGHSPQAKARPALSTWDDVKEITGWMPQQ